MRFAIFRLHLSKLLRLPRKSDTGSYEVLHLSRKIISANLKIWCSKMQLPLRKSAPGPPNSSDEHVSCTAPATENASLQTLFKCPTPAIVFGNATKPSHFAHFWQGAQSRHAKRHLNVQKCSVRLSFLHFWLGNVLRATPAYTFSTSQLPKVVRTWCALCILTSKCASRHNGVHFFDIATSKSAPKSEVFLPFALANVLRATTACNFFSLLCPAGSAPAALASLLFDPPEPQIIGKTQCFATFLPFRAPGSSFFWDFLFFDLLSSSLLFADSSHLCFSSVHIVGSLTSKLPSMIL